ncbi:SPOR domain-containing protein [Candidatus Palauibacter sp.]|uniref:SPOR domain-containing protein n=1 Tax=Candidatus Palauibacter sp. TaxID=3101350 RepID=UPI003B52B705
MNAHAAAPFGWELPERACIVAVVFESSEAERSATVVDAIATSIARRRRQTLLLNSEPGPSPLDELAGGPATADSGGMASFLAGRTGLAQVAVQRADCPYAYLPAGQVPEGVAGLLDSAAFERFVSQVKERGGTLFLAVSERSRPAPGLLRLLDGYIALGAASVEDLGGLECYGRVPFESLVPDAEAPEDAPEPEPAPVATPPEPPAAPEPAPPIPEQAGGRRSRARPFAAVLVIAALAAGNWWAYRNGWLDSAISRVGSMIAARDEVPASPVEATPATEPQDTPVEAPDTPAELPEVVEQAPVAQVPEEAAVLDAFESASERPYSVLVGSFGDPVDAAARVEEIRALHAGAPYFTAPTTIRGVLYQRILAGALASEAEASVLMDELVAAGAAEEASAWLLRPVRFAYDLGVFADRPAMEARIAELGSRGLPAYSLEAALDGMPVFRVYGGAYESEQAAAPMAEMLEAAGEPAALIVRRGGAIPPSR